jgi:hypothetical protein
MTAKEHQPQMEMTSSEGQTTRSTRYCVIWLLCTLFAFAVAIFQALSPSKVLLWLLPLYCLQSFIAEVLGVRADQTSVTVPTRFLSAFPFLVFWRQRISWDGIANITSMPKAFGIERILVRKKSGGSVTVIFRNRDEKLLFFKIVREMQPSISIYRAG